MMMIIIIKHWLSKGSVLSFPTFGSIERRCEDWVCFEGDAPKLTENRFNSGDDLRNFCAHPFTNNRSQSTLAMAASGGHARFAQQVVRQRIPNKTCVYIYIYI